MKQSLRNLQPAGACRQDQCRKCLLEFAHDGIPNRRTAWPSRAAPDLSPAQLQALIQSTARPAQLGDGRSEPAVGLVDACAALESLLNQPVCSRQSIQA